MKVILLADVKGVGKKDQTINASEGYVKNFLFPRKLAVEANSGNLKKLDNQKKAEDLQRQEELDAAKALGEKIAEQKVVIKVKTGDNGKLFVAITNNEIAVAVNEQTVLAGDKSKIAVDGPVEAIGEKEVTVKLHPKVSVKLKVEIEQQ